MKKSFILIIVFGLTLAACGSDSKNVPSMASTPTVVAEKEPIDNEAKAMAFTQCMRDQGIEYRDPIVDSEGNVQQPDFAEGVTYTRGELAEPYSVCSHHLEGLTFGRERQVPTDQIDYYIELAECLRDKSFDVDDPAVETLQTWLLDFRVEFDWDDPKALADYEECNNN